MVLFSLMLVLSSLWVVDACQSVLTHGIWSNTSTGDGAPSNDASADGIALEAALRCDSNHPIFAGLTGYNMHNMGWSFIYPTNIHNMVYYIWNITYIIWPFIYLPCSHYFHHGAQSSPQPLLWVVARHLLGRPRLRNKDCLNSWNLATLSSWHPVFTWLEFPC